jgi:NitT/TauT family transport system substrate-binding protein
MKKEEHMDTQDRGDQNEEVQTTRRPTLVRRDILRRAGIGAGALALGGAATTAPALARGAFAVVKSRPRLVLGYSGATCEAALYLGYHKGFFADEGLDVELYAESLTYDDIHGLSSGTLAGEQNPAFYYFAALEQGAALHLVGGIHGNCLRLLIGAHSGIKTLEDFKGKVIGIAAQGDPGMTFFTLLLARNGVDPKHDVTWKVVDLSHLGAALDEGEIQAVATWDPFGYALVLQGKAIQVGSNLRGLYGNTAGLTPSRYCCNIALSGKLVRDQPKVAAALTRAWLKATRYASTHIRETATIETRYKYIAFSQPDVAKMLGTYRWMPSATLVKDDILAAARVFKESGMLNPNTDPVKLARVAYANVFQLAGEPIPSF